MAAINHSIFFLTVLVFSPLALAQQQISILQADGPDRGLKAYELIKKFAGKRSIESPDLYPENHPEIQHIYEETDDESNEIDMWRGTEDEHFVRPKWDFYRSLKSKDMQGSEQDKIRFVDFKVIKY